MPDLGKLDRVKDIRSTWPDEARDFTPWLAQEANLAQIGETLGYGADWLEHVQTEADVGAFKADILCRDTAGEDAYVIIENQFGATNHDHLGKLLTYAAGRGATTVIWIAEVIRDEHRAAIDLLNTATDESYSFFALEIELWRIGESALAPRFNVIAKPNNWTRATKRLANSASRNGLTELKRGYVDYWVAFKQRLESETALTCQEPRPQQWMLMRIGRSNFTLTANVNSQQRWINVMLEFHGDDAGRYYNAMKEQREEINADCHYDLAWEDLPGRKSAHIRIRDLDVDPTDRADWTRQHDWMIERLQELYRVFHERVRSL
jgi:hypothetical protein